jgi:hypothetical protein
MLLIFLGFLGLLVLIHMARPRFLRRELSSARFFKQLPQPKQTKSQLHLGKPPLTRSFIMQLLVLLLLITALLLSQKNFESSETRKLGVWFILDTSASMTTLQKGKPRIVIARREIDRALDQIKRAAKDLDICFKLSALDMERRDLLVTPAAGGIREAVNHLEPRALGTNLDLVRTLLARLEDQGDSLCFITHLVVLTDHPAPDWILDQEAIHVVWRDVGSKVDNIGFTTIQTSRNPLTGLVRNVNVEVTAYGKPPANARVQITGPDDARVKEEILSWQEDNTWRGSFKPNIPGRYRMRVSPGGAYQYDDTAVIDVGDEQKIRVDWQLGDRRLLRQLHWVEDRTNPHLVVTSLLTQKRNIPTLVIGRGYGRRGKGRVEIRDFIEKSPLLEDVNLDAVESLGLDGIELPEGFSPVLRGTDGQVWLALQDDSVSPCAYVPGLPTGTDDLLGRFSATVFFNAFRWLLKERTLPPLYTLTAPHAPEPSGNRLVLHQDEGNTSREPHSSGSIDLLESAKGHRSSVPIWPIPVMLAVVLFLIERALAVYSHEEDR